MIRAKYLVDAISVTQVRGLPFKAEELAEMLHGVVSPHENATDSVLGVSAGGTEEDA
jgi:2-oxoglutarate ferredoxin oxidoreductase subunit alpha